MSNSDRKRIGLQAWKDEKNCDNDKIDLEVNTANVPAEPDHQGGHRGFLHRS